MVDIKNLRSHAPYPRRPVSGKAAPAPSNRRASSVPAASTRRPEWLDRRVSMTPSRHKRTLSQALPQPQEQPPMGTRALRPRSSLSQPPDSPRAATPTSRSRSRVSKNTDMGSSTSQPPAPARKRKRTASPSVPAEGEMPSQGAPRTDTPALVTGLLTPAPSFPGRARSKTPRAADGRRLSRVEVVITAQSRKDKGKAVARVSPPPDVIDAPAPAPAPAPAASPASQPQATAKRRGPASDPAAPPPPAVPGTSQTRVLDDAERDGDDEGAERDTEAPALLDADFCMLDVPEVAALRVPWHGANAVGLDAETSLYVPPGVAHLIASMKRALDTQTRGRTHAEARHAEELQRRVTAERTAAALAGQNALLEAEAHAWRDAAAAAFSDAFAATLGSRARSSEPVAEKTYSEDAGLPHTSAAVRDFFKHLLTPPVPDGDRHMDVDTT